jgi:hypothetical protein
MLKKKYCKQNIISNHKDLYKYIFISPFEFDELY